MQRLGDPPTVFADRLEVPVLQLETGPHSGAWEPVPLLARFVIRSGSNQTVPTAEIVVNLAGDPAQALLGGTVLRDWQVADRTGYPTNVWDRFLGGRRIRIRTSRGSPQADWCLFEGFVEKVEIGWSGSSRRGGRSATIFATSTLIAADRELDQQLFGQWRRPRLAAIAARTFPDNPGASSYCVRVGVPLVFNPHRQPNCHPMPLTFADGTRVYIPCDPDEPGAVPYTIIKMLRYIQWAAIQPAPWMTATPLTLPARRYQQPVTSRVLGVNALADGWTSFGLRHANLDALCESFGLSGSIRLLDLEPAPRNTSGPEALLLAAPPDVAVDGFSVLEALAFVAERSGLLLDSYHAFEGGGDCRTYLRISVRGGRTATAETPITPGVSVGNGFWARGVWLYVQTDQAAPDGETPAAALRANLATEGKLLFDDSGRRAGVLIRGSTAEHEVTVELRPGWKPDSWWDVDPDNPAAQATALANVVPENGEWAGRYVTPLATPENRRKYGRAGRYWTLNEDGAFGAADYARSARPWSSPVGWAACNFRNRLTLSDLAGRSDLDRDAGWSTRRRKFLVPEARLASSAAEHESAERVGIVVELSFDSGATWSSRLADVVNEDGRCAITISTADLRTILSPGGSNDYVRAYIAGRLRVRVNAAIAGDDALYGWAQRTTTAALALPLPWWDFLDRPQFVRKLREAPASHLLAAYGLAWPASLDQTAQADAEAERKVAQESPRRVSGSVVLPYLMRPSVTDPWPNYRLGDEVLGVRTGAGDTFISFGAIDAPAPRIVGLVYNWSVQPAECSTTVVIEDDIYGTPAEGGP